MQIEARNARKFLYSWQLWLILVGIGLLVWFVSAEMFPTVQDLAAHAPVLRIYSGSVMIPTFVAAVLGTLAVLIFKAIPASECTVQKAQQMGMFLVWLNVPCVLFALLISRPLQHHYLPKHGYTQCDQLQGNPTIWFTDWVKNPSWCVRGKDRKWVLEQARITQETAAPSAETK